MSRAERRRKARAEQKTRRRLNHPRHGYDPDAVKLQLLTEAGPLGIRDLIAMVDGDLEEMPEEAIELARSAFDPSFSVDARLIDLVRLAATVCELYADGHPDGDEAEERMLRHCGLTGAIDTIPKQIEVVDTRHEAVTMEDVFVDSILSEEQRMNSK